MVDLVPGRLVEISLLGGEPNQSNQLAFWAEQMGSAG